MKKIINFFRRTHILSYIVLVFFVLIVVLPLIWVIIQSFKTTSEFNNNGPLSLPGSLYFKNYAIAWVDSNIGRFFLNSVIVTALSLVFSMLLCIPSAYVLSRFKFFGRAIIVALITAGLFINVNYIVTPIFKMINRFGFNVLQSEVFLTDNLIVLSLIYAVNSSSFGIYLLSGYLVTLPKGYEEAAKIDGCGYFGTLIRVVVPLSMPSIITVLLFNFLSYWNEYIIAYIFLQNPDLQTIPIGIKQASPNLSKRDPGAVYAALTMAMIPTIALYCLVQNRLTKGMSVGGLKG